jgi:hypothetical protein
MIGRNLNQIAPQPDSPPALVSVIEPDPLPFSKSQSELERIMKHIIRFGALAALALSGHAVAAGGIAHVAIVDRRTRVERTPHFHRGEYWVPGAPGASYAIEIRNRLGERLLAVTSVDGVNVISGESAAWDQTGYVFDPGQAYQITGWRKSDAEVAAFTFTDSPNSYAQRTGRPANVGVIGVALFRERQAPQVYEPADEPSPPSVPAPSSAPLSSNSSQESGAGSRRDERSAAAPSYMQPAPKLGTGHGERETSYVSHTEFIRMQLQPNEIIRIRYDSFENLVAMGIIERPHRVVSAVNPFPDSGGTQYVPDP